MSQETLNVVLLLVPLIIGALIAAINANQVNDATEGAEARLRGWRQRASVRTGFFSRYVLNPLLWTIVKFCDWTDGFAHRGFEKRHSRGRNALCHRTLAAAPLCGRHRCHRGGYSGGCPLHSREGSVEFQWEHRNDLYAVTSSAER